jgi:hypothetical protein
MKCALKITEAVTVQEAMKIFHRAERTIYDQIEKHNLLPYGCGVNPCRYPLSDFEDIFAAIDKKRKTGIPAKGIATVSAKKATLKTATVKQNKGVPLIRPKTLLLVTPQLAERISADDTISVANEQLRDIEDAISRLKYTVVFSKITHRYMFTVDEWKKIDKRTKELAKALSDATSTRCEGEVQ